MDSPPAIPDHTLLRPIGRGAYGEVWLARNVMGALRAVKIIWRRQFDSDRPYEREFAGIERYEPVSRSSGGLVHVLHVGRNEAEGYFYYVMELADDAEGKVFSIQYSVFSQDTPTPDSLNTDDCSLNTYQPRTLRSDLKRLGRLPTAECLRLALDVISGLAQLHGHGLVHRDVKPGNIIYVHGRAKLADLGLLSVGDEGRTFVGTEGYIPPEGPGSSAADLYALGIVLYEASTGHSPEKFPDAPAEWFTKETGSDALEFHEIILKACEAQRERRYESAEAMQADLALLQSGQSVRRVRALERRYARLRLTGIVGTILLACALVAVFFANYRARLATESRAKEARLREQAQNSLVRAEAAERETEQQLYTALLEQGRAIVRSGELGQRVKALDAIRRAAAISNSAELRGVAIAAHVLPDLRFKRELPYGPEFTVRLVDPSFERIALCRRSEPVEIRSTSDQRLLATLPASTNLAAYFALWSADGRFLAVQRVLRPDRSRSDNEIWSVAEAQRRLLLPNVPYDGIAFHPRLPRVLVGGTAGVAMWDLEQGAEISRIPLNGTPRWLRFAPDGERFAATYAVGRDWIVSVHRITGELLASNVFDKFVPTFNWHPSGGWLSVPDYDGSVHRMDAQTGEKRLLGGHKSSATRTEFSADGAYLITGGWERELICWDARTLKRAFTAFLNGFDGRFSADGRTYALDTETGVQLLAFERAGGHREFAEDLGPRLLSAAFSPDSRWLAAAGRERLGVWDLQNGGPGALATNAGDTRIEFAANSELFADRRGAGFRWRVSPGPDATSSPKLESLELAVPAGFVSLCLVSNGVVMSGARGSALVGHEQLGAEPREWKRSVDGLNGVSPDGRWLAMYRSFTPHLVVHRLPDLERVAILTNAASVYSFEFSPAGDELAVSCRVGGVELWSTATWQRTRTITNLNNQLYSADVRVRGGFISALVLLLLAPEAWAAFTGGPSVRVSPNTKIEIRWTANFVGDGKVEIFDNPNGGVVIDGGGASVSGTGHTIDFSVGGVLQADTTYFFRVIHKDPTNVRPDLSNDPAPYPPFFTGAQAIGDVFVDVGVDRAIIHWDANVIGIGRVDYGIASPDELSVADQENVTPHNIELTGLAPGTTYQFRVSNRHAIDGDSLAAKTSFFTTLPSDCSVCFTTGPSVRVTPNVQVEFKWITDVSWLGKVSIFDNPDGTGAPILEQDSRDDLGSPIASSQHTVKVTVTPPLTADTAYFFKITATDPNNSLPPFSTPTPLRPFFVGSQTIGDVFVDAGVDRARIFWDANVIGIGHVDYGLASPDELSVADQANVTPHNIQLTGLAPGTIYQVRVSNRHAIDGDSLAAKTGSFTTLPSGDNTPPTITATVPNQTLWYGSDVSVACAASDSGSGLANPSDASFTLSTSVPAGTETSSAVTDSRQVCDQANNCATAGPFTFKIDKKKPVITISVPANGATYALGQIIAAAYDCNDGTGSGIATCAGPVANGASIDTSAGSHVFTVTATDNVGNANSASVTYSVGYAFSEFLSPVDNPPTVNTGKAGRTYPIKWQLRDGNGNFVSALSAVAAVVIQPTACDAFTNDPTDTLETSTTGGTALRYDSATNQYQYNWASPGKGCYTLFLKLDSGQEFTAFFQLL